MFESKESLVALVLEILSVPENFQIFVLSHNVKLLTLVR